MELNLLFAANVKCNKKFHFHHNFRAQIPGGRRSLRLESLKVVELKLQELIKELNILIKVKCLMYLSRLF